MLSFHSTTLHCVQIVTPDVQDEQHPHTHTTPGLCPALVTLATSSVSRLPVCFWLRLDCSRRGHGSTSGVLSKRYSHQDRECYKNASAWTSESKGRRVCAAARQQRDTRWSPVPPRPGTNKLPLAPRPSSSWLDYYYVVVLCRF